MDIFQARKFASQEGWLSQTPEAFRNAILDKSLFKSFEPGAALYSIGDLEGGIYCLLRGGLRVSIAAGENGPYLAHLFRPGIWVGEAPLIKGVPRMLGLTAAGQTDTLTVPLHALQDILRRDPAAWRHIALLAFTNSELAVNVVSDLLVRDHSQRLVAVLMRLGNCSNPGLPGASGIEIAVSQEELAAMSNVARTTVNSTLRQLQATGAVEITYRRIKIVAPEKLRAMLIEEKV
ncbi:MAG: Crp/Fnr family transcriptional regulator [Bradyrhizobiaceae bacterium]|nr:MAG: Crp/Fnr family transcriptional regulator [Bradyrhizobiaceae bacterium]